MLIKILFFVVRFNQKKFLILYKIDIIIVFQIECQ